MANKSGSVNYRPDLVPNLPEDIWAQVQHYGNHNWGLPLDQSLLEAIVDLKETERVYGISNTAQQNIEIRNILRDPLRSSDHTLRVKAMRWVVIDWGNINKGDDVYPDWARELKNYDEDTIKRFVELKKGDRISSWSKILAFADSENYAIYDSYVVLALNLILQNIGQKQRFFMPSPQSDAVNKVFQKIKNYVGALYDGTHPVYMCYLEYMYLLKSFVDKGLVKNVLEAEMCLFAQGRKLSKTLPR